MTNHDLLNKTIEHIQENPELLERSIFFHGDKACVLGRSWCILNDQTPDEAAMQWSLRVKREFIISGMGLDDDDQRYDLQFAWNTPQEAVTCIQRILETLEVQELA